MKNSDKLLLCGFIAGLLFIAAIHVTLYAKYKTGHYIIYNADDDLATHPMQSFSNILFVSVRNIPDAWIKFSELAQVEKDGDDGIQYLRKGDTLLITGTNSANPGNIRHQVTFNLPYNGTLSVFNSSLSCKIAKNANPGGPVIYLQKSQVFFSGIESQIQFEHIKVVASDSSAAVFHGNTQVNNLEVQLSGSSIECTGGNFDQLSIVTDSVSRISLQSKHLLKAKIKTAVH